MTFAAFNATSRSWWASHFVWRVSYGDELTLHFGDLRPARSPKLKAKPYGAYILGLCVALGFEARLRTRGR